ncbi:MAG: sigma 54-interacting transcriptional regulator [Desulfobacterales bacterium]
MKERFNEPSQVRVFNDVRDEPEFIREAITKVFGAETSLMEMHLHLEGARLGQFGIVTEGRNSYSELHAHLVSLLHEPFAVAISNILQHQEIERVGGSETIPVDVRIITATHKNLEEMVRTGQFREDLWFRLNVFPIIIPPLRQRAIDIPALVDYFLEKKSMDLKIRNLPSLAPGAIEKLQPYDWPGNVRELENLVERTLILNQMMDDGSQLSFDPLPAGSMPAENMGLKKEDDGIIRPLDEVMANHIQKALDQANGRVEGKNGAASMLGINPGTLRGRMKKLKISYGRSSHKKRYG